MMDPIPEPKFTRLAVRSEGGLILGKSFNDCLEPGMIYEIRDVLGDGDECSFIIKKIGPSSATINAENSGRVLGTGPWPGGWGHRAGDLLGDGSHLLTADECEARFRMHSDEQHYIWEDRAGAVRHKAILLGWNDPALEWGDQWAEGYSRPRRWRASCGAELDLPNTAVEDTTCGVPPCPTCFPGETHV